MWRKQSQLPKALQRHKSIGTQHTAQLSLSALYSPLSELVVACPQAMPHRHCASAEVVY